MKDESGPDHRKRFQVEVRLKVGEGEPGKALARGMGSTKKQAEQDAARRALERLRAREARSGVQTSAEQDRTVQEEEPGEA
jgi:ribonuclease-3